MHVALYIVANLARFLACVFVARKMSHSFSRILDFDSGQRMRRAVWGEGKNIRARPEEHNHSVLESYNPSACQFALRGGCGTSIHQRMRKSHFRTVYGAVARALEHGEHIVVFGVEDYGLDSSLLLSFVSKEYFCKATLTCPTLRLSIATDMFCRASAIRLGSGIGRSAGACWRV